MIEKQSLAAQHADSLLKTFEQRADLDAPFGWTNDYDGEWTDEVPECWTHCINPDNDEHECDTADMSAASAIDFLSDVLNIKYVINSDRSYNSGRVMLSYGGPNVWVDTRSRQLEVYWDTSETRTLPREFVSQLDDALAELWEMGA